MNFPFAISLVAIAGMAGASCDLSAQELSSSVLEKVRRACVEVHIKGQLKGGGAFVRDASGKPYVLTAAHLFNSPSDTCFVLTEDDRSYFASLSAYDLGHDLAILEVAPETKKYGALQVATAVPAETRPIFNFGPALRRRTLVLPGTVADARTSYTDFSASRGYIAHFFASGINPILTSGGVWVNQLGQVVGVQHGRLIGDKGSPSSGLSMVSPPSAIRSLLKSKAVQETPGIGGYVWEVWTSDQSLLDELPRGIEGLVVNPVFKGRALDQAGLQLYDVIVSCDGEPVKRRHDLLEKIRSKPAGSEFTLQVIRPGSQDRGSVTLTTEVLENFWD